MDHNCSRSKDIDRIMREIDGNGKPGLRESYTILNQKFENMDLVIKEIRSNVQVLLRFQTQRQEADKQEEIYKQEKKDKEKQERIQKRWFIGLATTTILGLAAIVISLLNLNNRMYENQVDKNISQQEFKKLIEEYEKNKSTRGASLDSTYSELLTDNGIKLIKN